MSESEEKIITILSAEFTRTFLIALSTSCTQLNPDDTTFLKTFKSLTGIFLAIYLMRKISSNFNPSVTLMFWYIKNSKFLNKFIFQYLFF